MRTDEILYYVRMSDEALEKESVAAVERLTGKGNYLADRNHKFALGFFILGVFLT